MIDLHLHTTYSDGADSLIEVLKKAESLKLEYISITDHDTCEAYKEVEQIDINRYFTGTIINGVEIKCSYQKRIIEILGYNVDTNLINENMDKFHKEHSKEKVQQKYFDIQYETCLKKGLKITPKKEIDFNPRKDWASVVIYNEIKKYPENKQKLPDDLWNEFTTFSKKYCGNPNTEWYIDKSHDYLSIEEAIKLVHKAGGLAFIAHIFIYKWAEDKEKLLDDIVSNYDIDGIECMHSDFSQEEIEYLLDYTKKNKLYRSGGSDYHGSYKPGIEMKVGKGNLRMEKELIEDWIKHLK